MSTKSLEEQVKSIKSKISNMIDEIEGLDKYYADKRLQPFHLNTQKRVRNRQNQRTIRTRIKQTDVNQENHFKISSHNRKLECIYQLINQTKKMDVNSVAVFLLENSHKIVLTKWSEDETQDFNDGFSVTYRCVTFLIKKTTTLQQICLIQ